MAKKFSTINFSATKSVIMYDLSPCAVTAKDIASESSNLDASISLKDKGEFNLPNTTLVTKLNKEQAEKEFRQAVYRANPYEKITTLFIVEVDTKNGYIENND